MRRRQGFTLIELLVVISIIALLVAILAPALSKVKEQARSVICSAHQKELTVAWRMYTVSNNGGICSSYVYADRSWEDASSWVWAPWDSRKNKAAPLTSNIDKEERMEGIERGALWPYTGEHEIYRCNSDASTYQHGRSYSIVDNMNGKYADIYPEQADWRIFGKVSEVPRPSESYIFIEENDPVAYNRDSFLINVGAYSWWDLLAVWHKGASSFSFADGHVEQRHWSEETVSQFTLPNEKDYKAWNPVTAGGIDDFNWMQAGWAR
ncbi:MAG: prepilin-type N-terminal cleavage/methylation domain-containing protein [Sedimentisphaerales bacterium]|nr:prepilin-type N-terminal cleavage/methylation domain-containing protein [Sedimentisphaerales bacterium]